VANNREKTLLLQPLVGSSSLYTYQYQALTGQLLYQKKTNWYHYFAQCTSWYHYAPAEAILFIRWYELYISIERSREDDSNDMYNLYQRMNAAEVMIVQHAKIHEKLSIFHLAQSFGCCAYT
jgi:hypothetical protein